MALGRSDNLTVSIGADSSKLRADLALAQAHLREFSRELRVAAAEARRTGETAHLQAVAGRYQALEERARGLRREISAGVKSNFDLLGSIAQLNTGFGLLRTNAGLAALAIGGAAAAVVNLAKKGAESVDDFGDLAKAIGVTDERLGQIREAFRRANIVGDEFDRLIRRFAGSLGKAQQDLAKSRGEIAKNAGDVEVLGRALDDAERKASTFAAANNKVGTIIRGGVKPTEDSTNSFTKLEVSLRKADGTLKTTDQALTDFINAMGRLPTEPQKNAAAMEEFGRGFRRVGEAAEKLAEIDARGEVFPTPSQGAKDRADAFLLTWNNLVAAIERSQQVFGGLIGEALVPQLEAVTGALQAINRGVTDIRENFPSITPVVQVVANAILGALSPVQSAILNILRGIQAIGGSSVGSPEFLPGELSGGMARGGAVRGPGTGTSDSILARISNGEFIINAASTGRIAQRYGAGFLQGLNNFAQGGFVGMPPVQFAEGGLVAASSTTGRPVHLHLGSQSFALSGSESVVDALVSASHAQQIRSAGNKPSWFAGRPNGR